MCSSWLVNVSVIATRWCVDLLNRRRQRKKGKKFHFFFSRGAHTGKSLRTCPPPAVHLRQSNHEQHLAEKKRLKYKVNIQSFFSCLSLARQRRPPPYTNTTTSLACLSNTFFAPLLKRWHVPDLPWHSAFRAKETRLRFSFFYFFFLRIDRISSRSLVLNAVKSRFVLHHRHAMFFLVFFFPFPRRRRSIFLFVSSSPVLYN